MKSYANGSGNTVTRLFNFQYKVCQYDKATDICRGGLVCVTRVSTVSLAMAPFSEATQVKHSSSQPNGIEVYSGENDPQWTVAA